MNNLIIFLYKIFKTLSDLDTLAFHIAYILRSPYEEQVGMGLHILLQVF